MPDRATLEALLERVERGDKPDRSLDAAIIVALADLLGEHGARVGEHGMVVSRLEGRPVRCWRAPPLTESVDAVLHLKARVLPNTSLVLGEGGDDAGAWLHVRELKGLQAEAARQRAPESDDIPDLARALLAALLKALIAREASS